MTSPPPPSDNLPILCPQSYFSGGNGKIVWANTTLNPNPNGNCIYTSTDDKILGNCSKTTLFVASEDKPPPLTNGICDGILNDKDICTTHCMWAYSPPPPSSS